MPRPLVVIGMLGSTRDAGHGPRRWDRWRPTIDLCRHEDLVVSRLELLHQRQYNGLARQVVADIGQVSPETNVRLHEVEFDDAWDFERVYAVLHDFARTYPFKPEREDYLVHIATGTHVVQICLFLLTESRELPARLVQTSPPKRQGSHDPGTFAIIDLDLSRYDRLAQRFQARRRDAREVLKAGIATRNASFNRLIERLEHVAVASKEPILLTGPTGAGKTALARRIYELRKDRRQVEGGFIEVNCATLRGDAAMSTLFGHVRGAFTGAVKEREGLLRAADGGLLFLDEVGELGLDEQAMLLRAVEEGVFLPMGSDRPARSRFQLLCGTNRDLADAVTAGRFREDLLARIDLWAFHLPGLAERTEDIEPNLDFELDRVSTHLGTRVSFNREARERFLSFATSAEARWPGNFRDFSACILRLGTLATGGRIDATLVAEEVTRLRGTWNRHVPRIANDGLATVLTASQLDDLDPFDRVQLAEVVRVCRASESLSEAGRTLFAASRRKKTSSNDADRLRKYLARFDLAFADLAA